MPIGCIVVTAIIFASFAAILLRARRLRRCARELSQYLRMSERGNEMLRAQMKTIDSARWIYRDIWDHLPQYLPMTEDRRRLAWEIGVALPKIEPSAEGPRVRLEDRAWLVTRAEEIGVWVAKVNDPVLTRLWEERSFWSLHEMLRILLFQVWDPSFDGRKGWAALYKGPLFTPPEPETL